MAGEIYEKSEGAITCTSITQHIPQTIYLSILSEIKNMVITALCELEKNHGNLDKLGIDISKKEKRIIREKTKKKHNVNDKNK